jgi:cobalt/nickel transport system ATP-binding protein
MLALEQVSFRYPGKDVLSGINFALGRGERVALVGNNGAGKTTVLHLMVGLHRPQAGRMYAFGRERRTEQDFREVRVRAGLLFQDADDQLFCPTVLEDVAFGPLNLGQSRKQALATAGATLATLGLSALAERVTHKLSGGEKRLVSLATVLAMQPDVLLLDEPTNGLDDPTEQRLLVHLAALPQAMVFVSHDRRLIEHLATRAVLLRNGTLVDAILHDHPHTHTHLHIHEPGTEASHDLSDSEHGLRLSDRDR